MPGSSEMVFFGDTEEDQAAGRESGCTFVRIGDGGIRDFQEISELDFGIRIWGNSD